ncbi:MULTISPECIES: BON domain-containing protein [unclassified Paraburkholderia]|uniref:BON domain-containing protein n=1 Tax=unclassified Paraburkholderia TaxID=2615204 RepID=UPI001F545BEB|nr:MULTISPECIES: BON domain-containing protein [unclassified Paraburkholderia]
MQDKETSFHAPVDPRLQKNELSHLTNKPGDKSMRKATALNLAVSGMIALTSITTWAQPGQTAAASTGSAKAASAGVDAKAAKRANRELAKQVRTAIAKEKSIDAANISVKAKSGAVTLYGTVPAAPQIDTAAVVAKAVPGVTSVKNQIVVAKTFGQ